MLTQRWKMENLIHFCKLSLNSTTTEILKGIDDNVKEILAILLLRRVNKWVLNVLFSCKAHFKKWEITLWLKFFFKKVFVGFIFIYMLYDLYVANKIVLYINSGGTRLHLREIYLKEHLIQELTKMEENQRLCIQLISVKFISVENLK